MLIQTPTPSRFVQNNEKLKMVADVSGAAVLKPVCECVARLCANAASSTTLQQWKIRSSDRAQLFRSLPSYVAQKIAKAQGAAPIGACRDHHCVILEILLGWHISRKAQVCAPTQAVCV